MGSKKSSGLAAISRSRKADKAARKPKPASNGQPDIEYTGKSVKSSLSFDEAVWDELRDLAHSLNKASKAVGGGRVSATSLIVSCFLDFRQKSTEEQLELLHRHARS